jgi:hypothetical protein
MAQEFDQNAQVLEGHMTEIKALLAEISSNTKSGAGGGGGGGGSVGPSGRGGRSAITGGSAKRGGGFGGALKNKLLGKAPFAVQAGAALGGAINEAVVKPAKKIAQDTIFNGARNAANFGLGSNAFQGAFNQAKSNIPIIGQGVSRVLDPINRAAQRTNAVTSIIARGGGVITDKDRAMLGNQMLKEEQRAQKDIIKNQEFFGKKMGSDETTAEVNKELSMQVGRLSDVITAMFQGG